jgi:hypothetical protein
MSKWTPPEPKLYDGITVGKNGKYRSTEEGYTLAQLLAVRREALEECAKLCEEHQYEWTYGSTYADAIRARSIT